MSYPTVFNIDADILGPSYSLTVLDKALGPLCTTVEIRCSDKLKGDFARHCRTIGRDISERTRELLALDVYGPDGVRTLLDQQLDVIGIGGRHHAPLVVPTAMSAGEAAGRI